MSDETKPVSAANADHREAAMLRVNACICGEITDAHLCLVRRGGANMDDLKQKCWCDCHAQQLASDYISQSGEKVKPCATGSEGACECPARKALTLAINTVECASIDVSEGPTKGDELPWYKAACAALSAPCLCEGPLKADSQHAENQRLRAERQRLWDLVRQQRMELHAAGLITNQEYAELAKDHAAVARLESYDEIRADREQLQGLLAAEYTRSDSLRAELAKTTAAWAGAADERDRYSSELAASQERERVLREALDLFKPLAGRVAQSHKQFCECPVCLLAMGKSTPVAPDTPNPPRSESPRSTGGLGQAKMQRKTEVE